MPERSNPHAPYFNLVAGASAEWARGAKQMSHREYFVQANRSDDKPTHNSSGAFDETSDRILQWQRAVKRKMPDAILESNPAFLVDVQQRLNCALSASFLWALISFDSRVLTAYPMDDQLIHPDRK